MATAGKSIQCRAAVAWEVNKPFSLETVEVAVPKKGEVRIKMASTGVCHSDLHDLEGINKNYPFPSVFGHEGAGVVESVGEGVTSVKPGDKVVLCFESFCGECENCRNTKTHLCMKTHSRTNFQMDGTSRITCKGQKLSQMNSISTFSEYTVTSEFNVAKVNPAANPNILCLAGCCIPTGYGAVMNTAQVPPGATCAVWGLGGVGMCVVMGCRDSGASKVIGIDVNSRKFELAKEFGCTDVINPKEVNVQEKLAEITNGGPDFCFVSVGLVPVMEEAFSSSHPQWGKTVIIGLANVGETMKVGIWDLIYGRKLVGTHYGGYKTRIGIPKLVEKVLNGDLELEKLITHRLPLEKINEGFIMLTTGESLRAIIDFDMEA